MKLFKKNNVRLLLFLGVIIGFSSCGKSHTEKLLTQKRWVVYDVKPPSGTFNIEKSLRAKQLKNGFYKNAWFEFLEDSLFVASFKGNPDTGRYAIIAKDEVSLYPKYRDTVYERLKIVTIGDSLLSFNTRKADFYMTLLLKAKPKE